MKYDRVVEKLKRNRKVTLYLGLPILVIILIAGFRMAGDEAVFRFLIVPVLIGAGVLFVLPFTNYDKKFERMRQGVGALNKAEFIQMIEQSEEVEDYYFVSPQFFFNFFSLRAYPRSQIRSLRCTESYDSETNGVTDYDIMVVCSDGQSDRIECKSMKNRDRLYAMLKNPQEAVPAADPWDSGRGI